MTFKQARKQALRYGCELNKKDYQQQWWTKMVSDEYTREEMLKLREQDPMQTWFKHKEKEVYKYQLEVFGGDLNNYEKVEEWK